MIFYTTILFSIILDIATKIISSNFLVKQINIFWDFLYLKHTLNSWIAFWINLPFLKIITLILIFWIFCYYLSERQKLKLETEKLKELKLFDLCFWLIIWWAIWNGIERIFFSEVTDFIWVKHFAVFNVADSSIFIWVALYIILFIKK